MKTMRATADRAELLARIDRLRPDSARRWGRMTAPQMVAHLTDQMHHTLGDATPRPVPGVLRWAPVRWFVLYGMPWPKGRVQGPPEAFVTQPVAWESDLETLKALVHRFAAQEEASPWPPHALFGRMTGRDWGYFCYKHFDHHLRQFGV